MKITNFNVIKERKSEYGCSTAYKATVDIHTGIWFWEKIETKEVFKDEFQVNWIFTDTGKFTPEYEVEKLFRAWESQNM